ncbi:hypothetical protein F5Y04DRAFT_16935 [Hypomontagnella monticulosa]|nr:hypothetical protein F5Y04DRAFT_16935 [Hypomontagnella monticulosa]
MSEVLDDHTALRLATAIRQQFPEWAAERDTIDAPSASERGEYANFILASNWVWSAQGLQELSRELQRRVDGLHISFDVETASLRLRCLGSQEEAVMAVSQSVVDNIVRTELANDATSSKITRPKDRPTPGERQTREGVTLALAPQNILAFNCREAWVLPDGLMKREVTIPHLLPGDSLGMLQRLTGCSMVMSNDKLMYIGAESQEKLALAKQKLNTLAKFAALPSKPVARYEPFIYAEEKQDGLAVFTYARHGKRPALKTFFLDRTLYPLTREASTYDAIFQQGVVVTLLRDDPYQPPNNVVDNVLAISPRPSSPEVQHAVLPAPFNTHQNPQVTSWVTQLPGPDLMLSHNDKSKPPESEPNYNRRSQNPSLAGSAVVASPEQVYGAQQKHPAPQPGKGGNYKKRGGGGRGGRRGSGYPRGNKASNPSQQQPAERRNGNPNRKNMLPDLQRLDLSKCTAPPGIANMAHSSSPDSSNTLRKLRHGGSFGRVSSETDMSGLPVKGPMTNEEKRECAPTKTEGPGKSHPNTTEQQHSHKDPSPELVQTMSQRLARMMSCLEIFTGKISLKVELGRLYHTNINDDLVHVRGVDAVDKAVSLQDMKIILGRQHVNSRDVVFTKILTAERADANDIASMDDTDGNKMWAHDSHQTIYEIICYAKTKERENYRFAIEVDSKDFAFWVYELDGDLNSLLVYCPKRSWDFRLTLEKSQDLTGTYAKFAEALVSQMRIIPSNDVPKLQFTLMNAYRAEILLVRTRVVTRYSRNQPDTTPSPAILEICKVHDMIHTHVCRTEDKITVTYEQHPGNQQLGVLPVWFEASVQSNLINQAFQQNRNLEFGDEVEWSVDQIREAGVFDDLIASATEVVKKIDRVGASGDNHQNTTMHGMPPMTSIASSQFYAPTCDTDAGYW